MKYFRSIVTQLVLACMAFVSLTTVAYAQSVGTYTESATGNVKNTVGVNITASGTQATVANPTDTYAATGLATISLGMNWNGTSWDRVRGDTNAVSVQFGLSSKLWTYTPPTGGLLNTTTAVTVMAAQGAGIRTYITGGECMAEPLGAATELVLLDGATVIERLKITTAGWPTPVSFQFISPLRGTANTALTMQTLTASVTGAVYCNWKGYTGT